MSGIKSSTFRGKMKPQGVPNPTRPATNDSTSGLVYSRRYLVSVILVKLYSLFWRYFRAKTFLWLINYCLLLTLTKSNRLNPRPWVIGLEPSDFRVSRNWFSIWHEIRPPQWFSNHWGNHKDPQRTKFSPSLRLCTGNILHIMQAIWGSREHLYLPSYCTWRHGC